MLDIRATGRYFNPAHSLFLFIPSLSLKYLNLSANALETIPPSTQTEESLSTLQELYLTGNNLTENCAALLVGHQNLRVLHVAYNQLLSFPARYQSLRKASGGKKLYIKILYHTIMC